MMRRHMMAPREGVDMADLIDATCVSILYHRGWPYGLALAFIRMKRLLRGVI